MDYKQDSVYNKSLFLDDYTHVEREFDYFHPKHEECCCDECEFCHEEQSVLDAIHGDFDNQSNAHAFASVVGYLFGIR